MKKIATLFALGAATPALAADGPLFSLANTDFIVLLAFIAFIALVIYFKVPGRVMGLLDQRAEGIRSDLDEARALRDEAEQILASYERKRAEVAEQADRIVAQAREDARLAAEQAKLDLQASIARRLTAAEEQIASAQAGAVREVRDAAITVAIEAARDVIASQMNTAEANRLIDDSIATVGEKLH